MTTDDCARCGHAESFHPRGACGATTGNDQCCSCSRFVPDRRTPILDLRPIGSVPAASSVVDVAVVTLPDRQGGATLRLVGLRVVGPTAGASARLGLKTAEQLIELLTRAVDEARGSAPAAPVVTPATVQRPRRLEDGAVRPPGVPRGRCAP